mgnify:CR=1 FL=1
MWCLSANGTLQVTPIGGGGVCDAFMVGCCGSLPTESSFRISFSFFVFHSSSDYLNTYSVALEIPVALEAVRTLRALLELSSPTLEIGSKIFHHFQVFASILQAITEEESRDVVS